MLSKSALAAALLIGPWNVLAQPQETLTALEARIERVESIRAIKRLQYAYGHYTEFGLWNDFADLFTDNAATNYQQGAQGREGVRKLFFEQVGQGKLGLAEGRIYPHILFQPVITLAPDGKSAKGRWRILAMLGGFGGGATWYSGVYENEYVLENGAWKISKLHSEPKVTAAYTASGWRASDVRLPLHYTTAANPIPASPNPARSTASSLASLAGRVARLNDQAAVTNVLDNYGYAIDRKQWDRAAALFADNGTLELGLQGVYAGKARIRRALAQLEPQGLSDHVYLQTLVTVAPGGRTANARGVELILSSANGGELIEGVFENTFVKQGSTWKIQSVHFYPRMIVDAATGWAKSAKPAPGPNRTFPPDRPPASTYEIYPKFSVAPFHFGNPVTGKPPQYPEGVSSERPAAPAAPLTGLDTRMTELQRGIAAAEAYDIAENLLNAHGYSRDNSPSPQGTIFANQVLQPVIDVAPDAQSVKVRARTLNPTGASGGAGFWTAGMIEGLVTFDQGTWKFQSPLTANVWSAPYPGGWGQGR